MRLCGCGDDLDFARDLCNKLFFWRFRPERSIRALVLHVLLMNTKQF